MPTDEKRIFFLITRVERGVSWLDFLKLNTPICIRIGDICISLLKIIQGKINLVEKVSKGMFFSKKRRSNF